jgi:hypothetical protein
MLENTEAARDTVKEQPKNLEHLIHIARVLYQVRAACLLWTLRNEHNLNLHCD